MLLVVSSGDFDGLLVCWFIGEGCFFLVCLAFHKNSSACFLGILGTLRNAWDSSLAAKEKLLLKDANLVGIYGIQKLRF